MAWTIYLMRCFSRPRNKWPFDCPYLDPPSVAAFLTCAVSKAIHIIIISFVYQIATKYVLWCTHSYVWHYSCSVQIWTEQQKLLVLVMGLALPKPFGIPMTCQQPFLLPYTKGTKHVARKTSVAQPAAEAEKCAMRVLKVIALGLGEMKKRSFGRW